MVNTTQADTQVSAFSHDVSGDLVTLFDDTYYRIRHYDQMPPFFVTVVSSVDHWLFAATTGGLTAGRINADHALFPYYTEDRISENAANTGGKTILRVEQGGNTQTWEPFTDDLHNPYSTERTLYKNTVGTSLIFEEVNHTLGLMFRYAWRTSALYGVVRTCWLTNTGDATTSVTITDGVQNILPAFATAQTQNELSVLLDAYKRNELHQGAGVGIYALSSRLTDLAEPSEALRANTVWQVGLDADVHLISSVQLQAARLGRDIQTETDVRGKRGAYLVQSTVELAPEASKSWHIVAEVDQDSAAVTHLIQQIEHHQADLYERVKQDIAANRTQLEKILGGADGLQLTGDPLSTGHHLANVLFNVMRGGTFVDQYTVDKADFVAFVDVRHPALLTDCADFFAALPESLPLQDLKQRAEAEGNVHLLRLCYSYLPLTFSRRHGDPSRPWNRFSIHLKNPDGSPRLNYEGNWRDIFQNWEALAYAYPAFIENMICVFLNATTLDGYNPYRIMRDGIDWEVPEPENPWANIGYWSDHQIIYLQKLMEVCERFYPERLRALLTQAVFTYADVPYRIKPYSNLVADPYESIDFDWEADEAIHARVEKHGTDGKLTHNDAGLVHATMAEKLLNLLLAKLVNFVPDGGIWMNTQRPEWNDANNALVGKGLSVVTTNYLRRYVVFFNQLLEAAPDTFEIASDLIDLLDAIEAGLTTYQNADGTVDDTTRREIMDVLGQAGSDYRWRFYNDGYAESTTSVSKERLQAFLTLAQAAIDRTIHANRRDDDLYHAYNTLQLGDGTATIHYLYPMLEGQVAVLSSGLLTPAEVVKLLKALRESPLYREDQHSYILYPDRELPGFLEKNTLDDAQIAEFKLIQALLAAGDTRLISKDVNGQYHFHAEMRNVRDLDAVLARLAQEPAYADLVAAEGEAIKTLFERVFNHDTFTGRSGSFFAYEGLGSIYWHMVSKLLLAVQENIYRPQGEASNTLPALVDAYYDVRAGLSFNKSPQVYGAFPLDPYSHTPRGSGAKQPGMTGLVKEEVLTRIAELGVMVDDGRIGFVPLLLRADEFLTAPETLSYIGVDDARHELNVPENAYAFTFCRVPFVVTFGEANRFVVTLSDGTQQTTADFVLSAETSQHIFAHDGTVQQVNIQLDSEVFAHLREAHS